MKLLALATLDFITEHPTALERQLGLSVTRDSPWHPAGTLAPPDFSGDHWDGSYFRPGATITAADAQGLARALRAALPALWAWQSPHVERVSTDYAPRDPRLCTSWTPGYSNPVVIESCFARGPLESYSPHLAAVFQLLTLLAPGGDVLLADPRPDKPGWQIPTGGTPLRMTVQMRTGVVGVGQLLGKDERYTLPAGFASELIASQRATWIDPADTPTKAKVTV